jgi:hypothetical protein
MESKELKEEMMGLLRDIELSLAKFFILGGDSVDVRKGLLADYNALRAIMPKLENAEIISDGAVAVAGQKISKRLYDKLFSMVGGTTSGANILPTIKYLRGKMDLELRQAKEVVETINQAKIDAGVYPKGNEQ